MYVRLGFSVAAHLEPTSSIDEVLAVGDAPFQGRCLGARAPPLTGGTTVLLVSHNLGTVVFVLPERAPAGRGKARCAGPHRGRGADVRALARNVARRTPQERSDRSARAACALRPRTWKGVVDSVSVLAAGEPATFIFEVSTCPGAAVLLHRL